VKKVVEQYLKTLAQLIATILVAIIAASADDRIDSIEWVNVIILALGTVSVLGAGNMPEGIWKRTKLIVSAATAGAVAAHTFLSAGLSLGLTEWLQIGVAVLGALGVYAVKGPQVVPAPRRGKHEARV
jgi:lysylphosphatidylglycerol synthetase-like protein (DUF2156 family)